LNMITHLKYCDGYLNCFVCGGGFWSWYCFSSTVITKCHRMDDLIREIFMITVL
jgi:hypothetical protein